MSARSRARRNKRRHIVPVWDLQVARYNHAWTVWVKKAKGMKGLYPVMINPRANGRIYRMRSMIESLGKGSFPVGDLDGDALKGVMIRPERSVSEMAKDWEKAHYSNYPHQHIPIAPIDYASLLSPQRQAESKTPQSIIDFLHGTRRPVDPRELIEITVPFEAKSIGGQINEFAKELLAKTNAVEGECEEVRPYTRPLLPEALTEPTFRERYNYWKENSLTVNDLLALCQALLTNASPMNPFLMSSHIVVLEIPEGAIEVMDNGCWLPNSAYFGSEIDEWVLDRTSFEHCLAITSINEIDHAERILKNKGFIKLTVQRPIFNETYDPRINYLDATRIKKHAFVVTLNTHEAIYYKGVLGKGILANLLMSEEQ